MNHSLIKMSVNGKKNKKNKGVIVMFVPIPIELDFLRTIPGEGGWGTIIKDIPTSFHKDTGIKKLDIVYLYDERMPESSIKIFCSYIIHNHILKRRIPKDISAQLSEVREWIKSKDVQAKELKEIWSDLVVNEYLTLGYKNNHYNVYRVNINSPEMHRICSHEVNVSEKDKEMLEDAYEIISFTAGNIEESQEQVPSIMDEVLRDILGSLELEGMSRREAVVYVLQQNILENKQEAILRGEYEDVTIKLPGYYYRLNDAYREYFGS